MSVVAIPELVTIDIAGQSDGGKLREENQAVVRHARTQFGDLLIVANGIGDAAGGGPASRKAAETISSRIESMPAFFPSEIAVEEAIRQANTELTALAAVPDCPYSGVGVTLVVALLRAEGDRARLTIGRVGDNRAYLVRDRKLTLLTRAHSATPDMLDGKSTTPEEMETSPDPSTPTRCLGKRLNLRVEMREIPLQPGDTLLLSSDGLSTNVSEKEIERVLADGARSVEEASRALLNLAFNAGGHENVAIEIARLTQNSGSSRAAARSVKSQSPERPKIKVIRKTPAIEWPAPESITYSAPLSESQLNATSSVPGTFQYHPGSGAVLAAGEHTLSVVFTPSNQSDYTSAQAAVPLKVAKATPSISWPTPEPINHTAPLGSAQLNAIASIPGTFAYSPAVGETLRSGVHTLSVTFTPADCVNYTQVQASVSLTVIESKPAVITWPGPRSISYGTVLGDEQFNASSSVPGSFLYVPAPGNVLPPGEHKLSVIFTPEDQLKYTEARAAVALIVEALPVVAPLLIAESPTEVDSEGAADLLAADTADRDELPIPFRSAPEARYAAEESSIGPGSAHADEESEYDPETFEEDQAEIPLFRSFHSGVDQSSIDVEEEEKRGINWLMVASVVIAIPMLCLLIFLVIKAHSGAPFDPNLVVKPPSAVGDNQPSSNTQDPSHQVKVIVDQPPAGTQAQPSSNSQPDNNEHAAQPTRAQTETNHDEPAAQPEIPQGSKKQSAANVPSSSSSGAVGADGPGGRDSVVDRDTQPSSREGTSNAVVVPAAAEAGRLMESRMPIYPPSAKASGVTGTVELAATISKDGAVEDLRAISGPVELRQAAVHAVRAWRYRPFMLNNEPMPVQTTINVVFSLDR